MNISCLSFWFIKNLKSGLSMTDVQRKHDTIRHIHNLQLPESLILALDDAVQAESIVNAIFSLQNLTKQWY